MMQTRCDALLYFVGLLQEGKMEYRDGELWKLWEPRRNWLPEAKRAEKRCPNGYLLVRSTVDGKPYYVMAHRVIWAYHHGTPPDNMVINHKDFDRSNNRVENLELITHLGNILHAKEAGRLKPAVGERHFRHKLKDSDLVTIRRMIGEGKKDREIAELFGVRPNQINRIRNGKRRG